MAHKAKKRAGRLENPPKPIFKVKKRLSPNELAFYFIFSVLVVMFIATYFLSKPGVQREEWVGQPISSIDIYNKMATSLPTTPFNIETVLENWESLLSDEYAQNLYTQGYLDPQRTDTYVLGDLETLFGGYFPMTVYSELISTSSSYSLFTPLEEYPDLPISPFLNIHSGVGVTFSNEDKQALSKVLYQSKRVYDDTRGMTAEMLRNKPQLYMDPRGPGAFFKPTLQKYDNGFIDYFGLVNVNPSFDFRTLPAEYITSDGLVNWGKIIQKSNLARLSELLDTQQLFDMVARIKQSSTSTISATIYDQNLVSSLNRYPITSNTLETTSSTFGTTYTTTSSGITTLTGQSVAPPTDVSLVSLRDWWKKFLTLITGRQVGACLSPSVVADEIERTGNSYKITASTVLCAEDFTIEPPAGKPLFEVTNNDVTIDCSNPMPLRTKIIGTGTGTAFSVTSHSGVKIRNCYIENFSTAISFSEVSNGEIINSTIIKNGRGVMLILHRDTLLDGNNVSENNQGIVSFAGKNTIIHNNDITDNTLGAVFVFNDILLFNKNNIVDNYNRTSSKGAGLVTTLSPLVATRNTFSNNGNASLITLANIQNALAFNTFAGSDKGYFSQDLKHTLYQNNFTGLAQGTDIQGLPVGPGGLRFSFNNFRENLFQTNTHGNSLRWSTFGVFVNDRYDTNTDEDLHLHGNELINILYNTTVDHTKIQVTSRGLANYLYVYYPLELTVTKDGAPLDNAQVEVSDKDSQVLWAFLTKLGRHPNLTDSKWPHLSYWKDESGVRLENNPFTATVKYGPQTVTETFNLTTAKYATYEITSACTPPPHDQRFALAMQMPGLFMFNASVVLPPMYDLSLATSTTLCPGTYNAVDFGMFGRGEVGIVQATAQDVEVTCDGTELSGHTAMDIYVNGVRLPPDCGLPATATWDDCFHHHPAMPPGSIISGVGIALGENNNKLRNCNIHSYTYGVALGRDDILLDNDVIHSSNYGIFLEEAKRTTLNNTIVGAGAPHTLPNTVGWFPSLEGVTAINSKFVNFRDFVIVHGNDTNRLINTTYTDTPESFALPPTPLACPDNFPGASCHAVMNVSWYLNTKVVDSDNVAVENAEVEISNRPFDVLAGGTTNTEGYTGDILLLEYQRNLTTKFNHYTPYTIGVVVGELSNTIDVRDFITGSKTVTVQLPGRVNTPPTIRIISPTEGTAYHIGPLNFVADVSDRHDRPGDISVVWSEVLAGGISIELGRGRSVTYSMTADRVGVHRIRATATDTDGVSTSAEVTITITTANPPTIQITSPQNNARFSVNESINFTAMANDVEEHDLSSNVGWGYDTPMRDLGIGSSITYNFSTEGIYIVSAQVRDRDGYTATATVSVNITSAISLQSNNTAPTVQITSPENNKYYFQNRTLTFAAVVTDAQETIPNSSITWTSNVQGDLGTNRSFNKTNMSIAMHTITATARDSAGLSGTASITIGITNNASLDNTPLPTGGAPSGEDDERRQRDRIRCIENYGSCPGNARWDLISCRNGVQTVICPNRNADVSACRTQNKTSKTFTRNCTSTPPTCNPIAGCPTQQMWDSVSCVNGKKTVYCNTNCPGTQTAFKTTCEVAQLPITPPPYQPPVAPPVQLPLAPPEQPRFVWWPWIVGLGILILIAGLLMIYLLTRKPKQAQPVVMKGAKYTSEETDQLDEYIHNALEEGAPQDEIIQNLVAVGWPKKLVEDVLGRMEIGLAKESGDEVVDYIKRSMSQGFNKQEISQALGKAGWEKKDVNDALRRI